MLWKMFNIADNERGLLYARDRLIAVLGPGRYRKFTAFRELRLEKYDISAWVFEHPKLVILLRLYQDLLAEYLTVTELSDKQVAVIYRDGKYFEVLPPGGLLATWKGIEAHTAQVFDITEDYVIPQPIANYLGRGVRVGAGRTKLMSAVVYAEVPDEHVGLLVVNGKLVRELQPGSYGYWKYDRDIVVKLVDLRLQTLEVSGQEILTKDRVSLRINLAASYRVTDAQLAAVKVKDYNAALYLELQLKLREAVGTKTLDALLAEKDALNTVIEQAAGAQVRALGIKLASVGVKDIILPGDMKLILNQVVEAQKEAEANVIKRKEETQAVRSLHNTAKVMENNPVLLRLKELETLEKITGNIDKISVYGGLDGMLNDLVKLAKTD
jgi:regulator of protease activity HflC (stomatin/prohibitin superfamily)